MLTRFMNWLHRMNAPDPALLEVRPPERRSMMTADGVELQPVALPAIAPPQRVIGMDGAVVATMDASNFQNSLKGWGLQAGAPDVLVDWFGKQGFIGYQACAIVAQHWLVEKVCRVPAQDAIRKGYKFTVNDGTAVDPKTLDMISRANKRHKLNKTLVQYVKMGRVFGVRLALFVVQSPDPDYYVKPFNPDGIGPGTYKGISQIDPYWVTPELTTNAAMDPASLDFYEPTYWIVNSKRVHKSHLVIMRGPEVADVLKPSYLYGGMSIPQMVLERVYSAERTANEAPQLAMTKRTDIFYTDLGKALANENGFINKLGRWAALRDNYGVKVADKEADSVERLDTSLADLDEVIMTQYQLVAAVGNMPSTKLLGTTPKGFSATGEYEEANYHEELESIQVNDMEPLIDRHMVCLIRSEIAPALGVKPFSVDCTWEPLDSLTAKEQAEVNKTKADTDKLLVDMGAIGGEEVRNRISADEQSGHNGLPTLTDMDPGNGDPAHEEAV